MMKRFLHVPHRGFVAAVMFLLGAAPAFAQAAAEAPAAPPDAATVALASCMVERNADAVRALNAATSRATSHPAGRRIAAVLNTGTLGCEALAEKANPFAAFAIARAAVAKNPGAAVPDRRMTPLARCLVARHPREARRYVDAVDAAMQAALQARKGDTITATIDPALMMPLLSLPGCGDEVVKVEKGLRPHELYADVLRLLPGVPEETAGDAADTATVVEGHGRDGQLRRLSACLWNRSREGALRIEDDYMRAKGAEVAVRLRAGDFPPCGAEQAQQFAMANAAALAQDLFIVRVNQAARCMVARDRTGVQRGMPPEGASAALDAITARARAGEKLGSLPAALLEPLRGCDVGVATFFDAQPVASGLLIGELRHALARPGA